MQDSARTGGWLIFAGFLVYAVVGTLSWYVTQDISLITIGGTLLLAFGITKVFKAQNAGKGWVYGAYALLIVSFILGRASNASSLDNWDAIIVMTGMQAVAFTLAGTLALARNGSLMVRLLCAAAIAGNLVYGVLYSDRIHGIISGEMSFDEAAALLGPLTIVDNLLVIPALVFALQEGTPEPAPHPNPFERQNAPARAPTMTLSSAPGTARAPTAAPTATSSSKAPSAPTGAGASHRRLSCPKCSSLVMVPPDQKPTCNACGYGRIAGA